jgi:hypothetical protein
MSAAGGIHRPRLAGHGWHRRTPGCIDPPVVDASPGFTISLGKMLGLKIVAEGVESAAVVELLKTMGCDEGQGHHFGAAMPADDFARQFLPAKTAADAA